MTPAPFGRRLLRVTKNEHVGAYNMIWVADPDGPEPEPGQFYMLAAEREWGGEDGRPYLPRAFSYARATESALAFLLEAIGPGTERLSRLEPHDGVWVTGPLVRYTTALVRPVEICARADPKRGSASARRVARSPRSTMLSEDSGLGISPNLSASPRDLPITH